MEDKKDIDKKKKNKKKEKAKGAIEQAIMKNIPIDSIKWISQPLSITMMKANLSPMQVDLVVEMVDKFQDKIEEQLKKNAEERRTTLSLFTDEEIRNGVYTVSFPLSDLDVRPDAYDELQKAAKALQGMQIVMPVSKSDGSTKEAYFSLFSRIEIPMRDGYNYKSTKRRVGLIEMEMTETTFNDVMRVGRQYTKYIKSVTRKRKCKYTSRMYMFISTYKTFGKWTIPYMEFHRTLGFSYEDEKGVTQILDYELYSDVKRRVLDPSRKELQKMSEDGQVDCYFDYEPIFPAGKNRGLPDKLVFTIYQSNLGRIISDKNKNTSTTIEIEKFLKNDLQQTPTNCQKLMKLLTEENRVGFQQKMKTLKKHCEDPANKVDCTRSYAWRSLNDYLQAHQPGVEEISATDGTNSQTVGSVGHLSGMKIDMPTNTKESEAEIPISVENQKRWNDFLECVQKETTQEQFQIWFEPMKFVSYIDNRLVIKIPSTFFHEILEEKFIYIIKKAIKSGFEDDTILNYIVMS